MNTKLWAPRANRKVCWMYFLIGQSYSSKILHAIFAISHKEWETDRQQYKVKKQGNIRGLKSSEIGEGCHMDWVWLFLCLRLKIVDISISCKNSVNQMLHQYLSPVLRVVYLTAAVLGKQCENKKVMKRPMSNRLKNILAALPDTISIRERKKEEGMDEEIVLVLSFLIITHSKKNYSFQICRAREDFAIFLLPSPHPFK